MPWLYSRGILIQKKQKYPLFPREQGICFAKGMD